MDKNHPEITAAISAEEAMASCPFLGSLPVEQAQVFVELAAMGRDKLDESRHNAEPEPVWPEKNDPASETVSKIFPSKVIDNDLSVQEFTDTEQRTVHEEILVKPMAHTQILEELAKAVEQTGIEPNGEIATAKEVQPSVNKTSAKTLNQISEIEQTPVTKQRVTVENPKPIERIEIVNEIIVEPLVKQSPDTNSAAISDDPERKLIDETVRVEGASIEATLINETFEKEVEVTFEQLVALLASIEEQSELNALEPGTDVSEPGPTSDFEELLATQTLPETPANIKAIEEMANDRPLEESLVSLALFLEETPNGNVDTEDISALLNELAESFDQNILTAGLKSESIHITPEITKNILVLLRQIGYENPGQTLLEFVSKHELEFLIQAIRYLAQLMSQDSQQASLQLKLHNPFTTNLLNTQTIKFGKLVLGLIRTSVSISA